MTNPLRTITNRRQLAAVALAVAVLPFAAGSASAASKSYTQHSKRAKAAVVTAAPAVTTAAAATTAAAPAAAPVTSVISIGGYVFYNLTYAEAVDAWVAAVAAAPPGHVQPPVTSVSVSTTVSGTVEDGNG